MFVKFLHVKNFQNTIFGFFGTECVVASRKIYPQTVQVNFDIIPLRSMPRNKFFVGSIFSGLFLPRNLRTKGLKLLEILKYFCDSDSDMCIFIRYRNVINGCPSLNHLNITSCRGLPRGVRNHHGELGIRSLPWRIAEEENSD